MTGALTLGLRVSKNFNLCVYLGYAVEIVLLSLLGLGLAGAIYDMVGDDGSDDKAAEDDTTPNQPDDAADDPDTGDDAGANTGPAAGKLLTLVSGSENPQATEGDDTIRGIVDGDYAAGGGNDLFDPENGYGAGMYGGDGNDTFAASYDSAKIYGGRGDDRFEFGTRLYEAARAYGGAGNDTFDLDFSADGPYDAMTLTGGSGKDVYNFGFAPDLSDDIEVAAGTASADLPSRLSTSSSLTTITDFRPGDDTLILDARDFDRAELVENQSGTNVVMFYGAQKSVVVLDGATGLKMETLADGTVRVSE